METIRVTTLPLAKGACVIDLGAGEGRHSHALGFYRPDLHIYAVDLMAGNLACGKEKGEAFFAACGLAPQLMYCQANGLQLPFADASIDCLICSEVLEHVEDYIGLIAEAYRVLKPGGYFAVSVPRAWPERLCWWLSPAYHQVEGGHIRIFDARALASDISAMGFACQARYAAHALHVPYWWLRCLFGSQGENAWPCRLYHRFLVWDLLTKPRITRWLEACLNPVFGKSCVWHFVKHSPPPA